MQTEIKAPVAILGFGTEGQAALDFLKSRSISDITICDENKAVKIPEGVTSRLGESAFRDLSGFNTIIRSPGVHYDIPALKELRTSDVHVTSMTDLTLENARSRVTAVTGSNGKTTVVAMVESILRKHYSDKIIVGGNDRKPVLTEALAKPQWPILMEVSSFQFADLHRSPHIAAILNITPNHLDWHENLEDYLHAKSNLIAHQESGDWAVLNTADENCIKLSKKAPAQIFWIGKEEGDAWVTWKNGSIVANINGRKSDLLEKKELKCKTHPDNILFATAIGLLHGADNSTIKSALMAFTGTEHRLEFIREMDSVNYYNDSACTTPESTMMAIEQFPEGKLILLLGGSSKKADFSFLAHHIVKSKCRVVPYGEEKERLTAAIKAEGGEDLILEPEDPASFVSVAESARMAARPGDSVVLSPACASFDMFKNAKERGTIFKEIVNSF